MEMARWAGLVGFWMMVSAARAMGMNTTVLRVIWRWSRMLPM